MKYFSIYSFVVLSLFFTNCASSNNNQEGYNNKSMHLRTTGEISVQPDQASITIYLNCSDRNITKSKKCLVHNSEKLNDLIRSYGIDSKDIITTSISQSKEHKWVKNSYVFSGYHSSLSTHLTVRDLNVLEKLYPQLLEDKNLNIGALQYSHSNLDSLSNLAYEDALKRSNSLADMLLINMDKSKKEIIRIGNIELPAQVKINGNYNKEYEKLDAVRKEKVQVNNGSMKVIRDIVVEYSFR